MINRARSRNQLKADTTVALGSALSLGSKYALFDNILWTWSEFDGKYKGCRWWSEQALQVGESLRHEHAIPRRVLIERLLTLPNPTEAEVAQVLCQYCVGVVVTLAEDRRLSSLGLRQRMPPDWDGVDVWARYHVAGIRPTDTHAVAGA